MRINFTSVTKENKNIEEIKKRVNEAFKDTDYKIKIIPCNYEKNKVKIAEYHRNYYIKNKDKIKQYHKEYNKRKKAKKIEEKKQVIPTKNKAEEETKVINNNVTKTDVKQETKDNKAKNEQIKSKKS